MLANVYRKELNMQKYIKSGIELGLGCMSLGTDLKKPNKL